MSQVHEAIKLLQIALPNLPIGTPPHSAVVKMIDNGAKAFPAAEQQPGIQQTQLRDLQQHAQQNAPLAALMRQMGQGQEGGAQGGGGGAQMPPQLGGGSPQMPPGM